MTGSSDNTHFQQSAILIRVLNSAAAALVQKEVSAFAAFCFPLLYTTHECKDWEVCVIHMTHAL